MMNYFWLPILSVVGTMAGVFLGGFKIWSAGIACVAVNLIYVLVMCYIVGLLSCPRVIARERGPYIYYYKEYQAAYPKAISMFASRFNKNHQAVLKADQNVGFLGLYWDDPRSLPDENECRSCIGFVLGVNASKQSRTILESMKIKTVPLERWQAIEATMKIWVMAGYTIAPMKLIPAVASHLARHYPRLAADCAHEVMYEYCQNNYTSYGIVVSEQRHAMAKLAPFASPRLNEKVVQDLKAAQQQPKKDA